MQIVKLLLQKEKEDRTTFRPTNNMQCCRPYRGKSSEMEFESHILIALTPGMSN